MRWSEDQWADYLNRAGVKTDYEEPKPPTKQIPNESVEQRALVRWLDMKGVLFCHVPNGGKRNIGVAKKMKAEGVKPGVPDVLVFDRPPKAPHHVGVAIELKRQKRGQVSEHQRQWLGWLEHRGWAVRACNGADEAVKWLEGLGY